MAGIFGLLMSGAGVIKDQYFNLTSLLLPGNGTNGAQNNTFLDSGTANSGSGFTITRNGNTTQGTFSPFSQTGWSNRFDGSSNYRLTIPDSTDLDLTGDFCLEMWVYVTANSSSGQLVCIGNENAGQNGFIFYLPGGTTTVSLYTNGGTPLTTSSGAIALNTWHHLALVRSGAGAGNTVIYVDGVSKGSAQITTSFTGIAANGLCIGQTYNGSFVGVSNTYISNVRLVKGSPVYTGAFTPPTTPLTAITNTKLLTCQSNRFVDANTQVAAKTITVTGSPSVTPFSPFAPTQSYSASAVGGSGYFDGTGDYLSVANQTALQLSGSQFTIEGWFYFTTSGVDNYIVVQSSALADANVNWLVRVTSGNKLRVLLMTSGATAVSFDGSTTVTANSWHHFAATCDGTGAGSNVRSWLDGVYQGGTTVNTANINTNTAATQIGGWSFASSYSTGYVSGLRILKGTALYTGTSDITVPTSPPTAITNTSLLLNFTNAGVVDATAKNVLETVGTAQISSTTSKFPPTSIYLSGDGNYLTSRSSPVFSLNGDFTMEAWVYPINAGRSADAEKYGTIVSCAAVGVANPEFSWFIRIVGGVVTEYFLNLNFTTVLQVTGLSVSLNAWHYFAVTRSGTGTGNLKLYIDGTLVGTSSGAVTQSATFTSAQTLMVGRNAGSTAYQNWLSGYFQDVRITPGYVRTVTTIPTAPFPVQ